MSFSLVQDSFSAKVEQTDEMTKETSDFFCPPMVTQQNEPANKGIIALRDRTHYITRNKEEKHF